MGRKTGAKCIRARIHMLPFLLLYHKLLEKCSVLFRNLKQSSLRCHHCLAVVSHTAKEVRIVNLLVFVSLRKERFEHWPVYLP